LAVAVAAVVVVVVVVFFCLHAEGIVSMHSVYDYTNQLAVRSPTRAAGRVCMRTLHARASARLLLFFG
jgi:hypothetical protein